MPKMIANYEAFSVQASLENGAAVLAFLTHADEHVAVHFSRKLLERLQTQITAALVQQPKPAGKK